MRRRKCFSSSLIVCEDGDSPVVQVGAELVEQRVHAGPRRRARRAVRPAVPVCNKHGGLRSSLLTIPIKV